MCTVTVHTVNTVHTTVLQTHYRPDGKVRKVHSEHQKLAVLMLLPFPRPQAVTIVDSFDFR